MKRHWDEHELAERWSLTHDEFELLRNRTERSRLGLAVLLKFFQVEGRFPSDRREVPAVALGYVANQVETSRDAFCDYDLAGRSCEGDRAQIRTLLGFRPATVEDSNELTDWLAGEVLPVGRKAEHVREAALEWCRKNRIEPPTSPRLDRIARSALRPRTRVRVISRHLEHENRPTLYISPVGRVRRGSLRPQNRRVQPCRPLHF